MFSRLLALFILIPVAELTIFYLVGSKLGLIPTLAIILLTGILGAALTKSQGARVLREFRQTTASGQIPHAPLIEGLIILVAGALLLTPGFLTDTIGFSALIPAIRRKYRRALTTYLASRIKIVTTASTDDSQNKRHQQPLDDDKVIDV
jgi:UPF0716 protein FxsA